MHHRLTSPVAVAILIAVIHAAPASAQSRKSSSTKQPDRGSGPQLVWDIPVTVRGAGQYEMGNDVAPLSVSRMRITEAQLVTLELFDAQYQESAAYHGAWLNQAILATAPAREDTALLHFANGMIIPVTRETLTRGVTNRQEGLFLAQRILRRDRGGRLRALRQFPPVARQDERYRDPRPITFSDNKIVAGDQLTGGRAALATWGFSPWYHVSSLKSVEWVVQSAYEQQFHVSQATRAGHEVYLKRCAYCHTVKMVGATYGWDFVHPLPVYQKRAVENLFFHVRYPKLEPIQMSIHMPHQPDFTKDEAGELWTWLKAVSEQRLRPYSP